jgi:hypothetical protein
MKDLVLISCPGIKQIIKEIPEEDSPINPNIGAGAFGELINKYFSFAGFYKVEKDKGDGRIDLKKIDNKIELKDYSKLEIVFPKSIYALISFANNGVSLVEGNIDSKTIEGTLSKCIGERNVYLKINRFI